MTEQDVIRVTEGATTIASQTLPNQLNLLRQANRDRQKVWKGSEATNNLLFKATELGEEAGEVLGAVKKLFRNLNGVEGNAGKTEEELRANLAEELADVLICVDLLADMANVDLNSAVPAKFNKTSIKANAPVFMDEQWRTQ